jgi:hypothetical protein
MDEIEARGSPVVKAKRVFWGHVGHMGFVDVIPVQNRPLQRRERKGQPPASAPYRGGPKVDHVHCQANGSDHEEDFEGFPGRRKREAAGEMQTV